MPLPDVKLNKRSWKWIALLALTAGAVLLLAGEFALRSQYLRANRNDIALWNMVGYSGFVHRIPNSTLSFRLFGFEGEELIKATVRLNNIGLMSRNDYHKEKLPGEFRIVVLGGEQTASSVADQSWPDFLEIELSRRLPGRKIRVLNFGWPDAGPEHYIEYWKNEAAQYQPEVVIVNFVETDFYRTITGQEVTYRGQLVLHGQEISYDIDGAKAKHYVTIVRGAPGSISLLNPMVVAPRPYGFFLDKRFFEDIDLVRKLQRTIVTQQIAGVMPPFGSMVIDYLFSLGKMRAPAVSLLRNFDPPKQTFVDKEKLVQFGIRTFGWISKNIPNVVLLHNFSYGELKQQYELTERMVVADSGIIVHDMRKNIPPETSDAELRSWYLFPYMGEKWSAKGHAQYAKLVANYLAEQGLLPTALSARE